MGHTFFHYQAVNSTNDVCRALASAGNVGAVVTAEHQTAGRGRRGRSWISKPGAGLLLSVSVPADMFFAHHWHLAVVSPLAAAEAVSQTCGLNVQIKWPNDLLSSGKKLGGILIEAEPAFAVVGIGINLTMSRSDFPPEIAQIATSVLMEGGNVPDKQELAVAIVKNLEHWLNKCQTGWNSVIETRRRLEATTGRLLEVHLPNTVYRGTGVGLDEDGALLLQLKKAQTLRIESAENVFIIR